MHNVTMVRMHFDRIVIGGGLFGAFASITLAKKGYRVCLIEQDPELLGRASYVNQARLHTGLHYPRSLETALECLTYHEKFKSMFPTAIRDFNQIYAISRFNSKTNGEDFLSFIERLGVEVRQIQPEMYFNKSSISDAYLVEEPTFDTTELRKIFLEQIATHPNITIMLNAQVIGGSTDVDESLLRLADGRTLFTSGLVIAAYAGLNGIRQTLGLQPLPLSFEIADVHLCQVSDELSNIGFTIMDGPFWSMMPFGKSNLSSLTSVGLTPIDKANLLPVFSCQKSRRDCIPSALADCNSCEFRPMSNFGHVIQQMSLHLKDGYQFKQADRLTTVKAILNSSEVDDSRPTVIQKETLFNVWTIFSGKVTTIFDIEEGLF